LATLLAACANAREVPRTVSVTATLIAETQIAGFVEARGIVWECTAQICTTEARPTPDLYACAALARQVGEIAAFGRDGDEFSQAQIVLCNGRARLDPLREPQ
jgi:hypothetical protein